MERYSRQTLFSPIGKEGQNKLLNSTVLIVGVGALGTVISNHLVRAGVGNVRIVDRDFVEWSNLQRQMLFDESDAEQSLPKAIAAKHKLEAINQTVNIEAIVDHVNAENIDQLVEDVDVILDGTDNLSTRFLLNDVSFKKGIPFAYGVVVASRGMTAFFEPGRNPFLRCLMSPTADRGQTCDTVGVISTIVDIVASLQVTETLKFLTGNNKNIVRALKSFDTWFNQSYDLTFNGAKENCLTCQVGEFPSLERKAREETVLCGRDSVQISRETTFDLDELENQLDQIGEVSRTAFLLKATIDDSKTYVIFENGRIIVQGTEDINQAKSWYDRYIGY